ncbi:MAG: hypothetical protein ACD_42C00069G0004 [uncultured bacterium]|nr:MAG: hypothetical protein ACD_42C00069G0004 [uncultured bacterium]OGT25750.1 MAG: hypothetical protein A3B71_01275 [Gammaproteobacteria bacterium RIFCSPHIGHO2_02_FULL_42_43]OGT51698.1 MAG: hypothetical protein A3E54_03490 [Gammaproteobacteria bacterium RIFCSPHIGHO2_12_FULL_41_25]OGT61595.1 MAG: hypothetical protein A3I77_03295 [Gammaproteobacteria bacterium RIFCSPLOWO2_02_FULL_42_14]OGT86219.1 MAG: hypothetical protein A3G86_06145 [Gammaproteobacteria bacterium RIFCSPLOWO2_12_FULL_42_18]
MLNISMHKNLLLQILKDIYSDISLGPLLGFKGETAAFLFYHLGRFSVDLDFDLLDEASAHIVFEKIKIILNQYGDIKEFYDKRYTLFFLLSYRRGLQNIKVEISKRQFGSQYHVENYLGIPMLIMNQEDVFANKLVALIERQGKTNRDIYDVWFFLKNNFPMNKIIVEQQTKTTYQKAVSLCIAILEKKTDRGILSGIGELLDEKQKNWAKSHLRKETIFLLKTQVSASIKNK